jgi:hypothetical protein
MVPNAARWKPFHGAAKVIGPGPPNTLSVLDPHETVPKIEAV